MSGLVVVCASNLLGGDVALEHEPQENGGGLGDLAVASCPPSHSTPVMVVSQ